DLQAICDREYHKLTGTVAPIQGKAAFSLVACVTPHVLRGHQEYMGRIVPRFLFYRLPQLTDDERDQGLDLLWDEDGSESRRKTLTELRGRLATHLHESAPISMDPETPPQRDYIKRLAKFVAMGRTVVHYQKVRDQGTTKEWYEPEIGQQEDPFRVQQQLRNLARGIA